MFIILSHMLKNVTRSISQRIKSFIVKLRYLGVRCFSCVGSWGWISKGNKSSRSDAGNN